jgi:hypothetical protein
MAAQQKEEKKVILFFGHYTVQMLAMLLTFHRLHVPPEHWQYCPHPYGKMTQENK